MRKGDTTAAVTRRLAAILCADVEGYSRLMRADEAGTLRVLASHRSLAQRLIVHHGGRVANTAGDSIVAEFPSAVDALTCALAVQERLADANRDLSGAAQVRFRIGLHVGEVMVRDGDILGDGVNVAARIEGITPANAVCLSETAHQFVHRALPIAFEDLGPQSLKNVGEPVRVYRAWPDAAAAGRDLPGVHRNIEAYLARRFHVICRNALRKVTEPEGIAVMEYAAMASLHDAPEITAAELADRISISRARTQAAVARLETAGLVTRNEAAAGAGGGRLSLTPRGSRARVRLRPAILAALDEVVAPLSEAERHLLRDFLTRIIHADETRRH